MKYAGKEEINQFTIRDLLKDDIPPILTLAEKALGKNYIQQSMLIDEENMVICAEVKGTMVGFCTRKIIPSHNLFSYFRKKEAWQIPELKKFTAFGWVGSIVVRHEYRRRGIGTALLKTCLKRLRHKGAEFVMMTAWKTKNGIHIGSIPESNGLSKRIEIAEFWKEDSLSKHYSCTVCNLPPCLCTAVIYTRP